MPKDLNDYLTKQLALLLYCCDLPQAMRKEVLDKAMKLAEAWEQEDKELYEEE
jgi:hypothetical protein